MPSYDVILSDPPWFYNRRAGFGYSRKRLPEGKKPKFGGGAGNHYPLMKDAEIAALRSLLDEWAAENCALFLWATCPRLDSAIATLKAWGFRFCTVAFVWEKINRTNGGPLYNPGYYTASNAELVLLGRRGSMPPERRMLQQIVKTTRREHSRKPDEVRQLIEAMYPNARRLEMFARESVDGWDAWGNEAMQHGLKLAPLR